MNLYQKINELSEHILQLKSKLETVAVDFLEKEERIEYLKIMNLIDFYIASFVELILEDNIEFINKNKSLVKDLIKNAESFIKEVNDNLNI